MLDRVDLYRTLDLSCAEMPQFLSELTHLLAVAVDRHDLEVLEAVRGLGERCRADRSLELRLVGD